MSRQRDNEWFVLSAEGELLELGEHDSFEEADQQANEIGEPFGWIISPEMVEQWLKTIGGTNEHTTIR